MRNLTTIVLTFAAVTAATACKKQDFVTEMCLSNEGTHQDCGIACKISESEEACKKWEKMTIELCDKAGKADCQSICEEDENEYACDKAKSM